ncbi:MAG: alpha/beta hydrolase [Hyphomicrobiales bacterium]|nr:MAG: alpha/beta hydrolase [Hyphomicrobiales bacterium]
MTDHDLFQISHIIPDFEAQFDDYKASSNATRRTLRSQLDVPYGDAPRQRLDLFFPPGELSGAPVHMFIHGGYWRAQVKEDYAFVADGVVAAGGIAAIIDYTLMPGARMADLVREVREAAAWLALNADEFGGDGTKLSASGHSAGGHLVTWLGSRGPGETSAPETPVRAVISISGIFDLRPITSSYLQPELHLTSEEVAHWSPIEAVPSTATHYEIVVGHKETTPFHQQAQDYSFVLARHGAPHERITVPDEDHMSVVRKLGVAGSPVHQLLVDAIERSKG